MKERIKTNDLSTLGDLKSELKANEPISENRLRTEVMLKSSASKKLLKYLFSQYSKTVDKYKGKNENTEFVEGLEKILNDDSKDLSGQNAIYLDDLFLKLIKQTPINQSVDKGVTFGRMAREAGCTDVEVEEAKKLLSTFIEPFLRKMFKN